MVEGEVNFGVYRRVLPLYFPRTPEELAAAREALPDDVGDEWGETQIAERQIRIAVAPTNQDTSDTTAGAPKTASAARRPLASFGNESNIVADGDLRPSVSLFVVF